MGGPHSGVAGLPCPLHGARRRDQRGLPPPPYRGRGYASSLVAELSRLLLERGNRFCCLFADTANPVSCGIYRRIGYVDRCIVEELQWLP
ncbi:MAG TPA: GNAT family N-acetyltransferase [Victivallis vadensis]|nr:GNAT family N-acetyltransferase [Victivallis vadensis]